MTRVLMIDEDWALTESVALRCIAHGIAVRMAETFCAGVRHLLETPVSLVILSSRLVRLPCAELAQLLDTIAPGVPVVVRVEASQGLDEQVRFELHGFRVVGDSFDVLDLVAKAERPARAELATPAAGVAALEALCR